MIPNRIDKKKLGKLLREGKGTGEIAKIFGVTPGGVSQARKKLDFAVAVDASTRLAPVLNDKSLTVMDRYVGLINKCFTDLEWIERTIPPKASKEYREWMDSKTKHTAEIRKLIMTFADLRTKIYNAEKVEKIIAIIMKAIGEVDIELQRRIEQRIREAGVSFRAGS